MDRAPAPRSTRHRATDWLRQHERLVAIGTIAGALVLAGIAVGLALGLTRNVDSVGTAASPSVWPMPSAASTPTSTPQEASPSATVTPSETPEPADPTPVPTVPQRTAVGGWTMTAAFDLSPGSGYVTDITAWRDGFVAVGSEWDSEHRVGQEKPAMWTSSDGRSWTEQPIDLGVDSATLIGVVERADRQLLLVGRVPGGGANPESIAPASVAWVSADASTWEAVALPLSDSALVDSLAHGPRGYAIGATTPYVEFAPNADPTPGELWFSSDGIEWAKTHEGASQVQAGDEGFVAVQSALAAGPSGVVASGDGVTWFDAHVAAPMFGVAPVGGDWLATATGGEPGTIAVWHSSSGLDWTEALDVNELTGPDGPKTGRGLNEANISIATLAGGAGHAFLTLGDNHCCAQAPWSYGVWWSTDGVTWGLIADGDYHVDAVAENGDVVVLGGHTGRGHAPTFWVDDH